ncbi:MAG: glycosyltransferase family 2 protein [Planctomycetota bacterium]
MAPSVPARVAVLLPTLNGEEDLARLLPALDEQTVEHERIAVDSSSEDGTVALLEGAGFRVTRIERHEFGHGRTRNLLAQQTDAEFLVFLSQDATPVGPRFLAALLRPFEDAEIGGAIARVLPNPDDDPLTVRTVLASPEASDVATTRRWTNPDDYAAMDPSERADLLRFNNVASCVRRRALEAIPFPEVPFGEDFAWAMRALAAGWKLRFEPEAVVHHAHRYGPSAAFQRYRTDAIFHREFHGSRIRPTLLSVAKGTLFEVKEDLKHLGRLGPFAKGVWRALISSPFLRLAQTYGQYLGSSPGKAPAAESAAWSSARASGAIGLSPTGEVIVDASAAGPMTDSQSRLAGGRP